MMDLAAFIITAVTGGVAGGLGYLAAIVARRYFHWSTPAHWPAVVFAVLGMAGGTAVVNDWLPSWSAFDEAPVAVADILPYMDAIDTNEPALYERIETSVIRDQNEGMSADRVRSNAAALVQSYVADKIMFLPDQLTYELYAATRDALAYLLERAEHAACADLALGRINGDLDAKLSPELAERSHNNTRRVIATKADPDVPKMPAEEFSQLATRAFAEASQTTGIPPDQVDAILAGTGEPAPTCRLMKAFFDAILSQPVEVAAAALRTLASGERAPTG